MLKGKHLFLGCLLVFLNMAWLADSGLRHRPQLVGLNCVLGCISLPPRGLPVCRTAAAAWPGWRCRWSSGRGGPGCLPSHSPAGTGADDCRVPGWGLSGCPSRRPSPRFPSTSSTLWRTASAISATRGSSNAANHHTLDLSLQAINFHFRYAKTQQQIYLSLSSSSQVYWNIILHLPHSTVFYTTTRYKHLTSTHQKLTIFNPSYF